MSSRLQLYRCEAVGGSGWVGVHVWVGGGGYVYVCVSGYVCGCV